MKKNRIGQVSLIVVSMMLLSLLGSGTSIAGGSDGGAGPIAAVTIEPGVISWEAQAENDGMILTIGGPGDFYLQQEYESGAQPTFKPVDGGGNALPDGIYKYELLLLPAKGEAPTEYDESQRGLTPSEGAAEARVLSGSFSILSGSFVTPQAEEGGTEGKIELGEELTDHIIADDLIVQYSACIGNDCYNGESFGFDTLRLKENNTRIRFYDTSTSASFPSNDWQITANDSSNGGANKFSIDDIDSGRTPFTIEAGARTNALYVEDGGRIGFGTSTPVVKGLHMKFNDTPTLRLEQDGSGGWTPQTWDVAGNEANFFIRDATNGSNLPFRIQPGAPTSSIFINSNGRVGLGTGSPDEKLTVYNGNIKVYDSNTGDATDYGIIFSDGTVQTTAATGGGSSYWTQSGSDIYYNSGKVGIGTTGPGYKLHIVDTGVFPVVIESSNGSWAGFEQRATTSGAKPYIQWYNSADNQKAWVSLNPTNQFIGFSYSGGATDGLVMKKSGNVGIGNTGPTHLLDVGTSGAYCNGGAWVDGSSEEYKTDIERLSSEEAEAALEELDPVKFYYKTDLEEEHLGFIAEDVPDLVAMQDRKGLSSMDIAAVLTKVVQEQQKTISELSARMAELEIRLQELEAQNTKP